MAGTSSPAPTRRVGPHDGSCRRSRVIRWEGRAALTRITPPPHRLNTPHGGEACTRSERERWSVQGQPREACGHEACRAHNGHRIHETRRASKCITVACAHGGKRNSPHLGRPADDRTSTGRSTLAKDRPFCLPHGYNDTGNR